MEGPRLVAMLMYPEVSCVDVTGTLEPFGLANFLTGQRLYQPVTVSLDATPVPAAGGFLHLLPTGRCDDLPEQIDLMLVAGGPGCFAAAGDEDLLAWIRRLEPRCKRIGSVCTGATVLAASGVADGHQIATHWLEAIRLKQEYPLVEIKEDAIFVNSGKLWTSAGMLAGIDLALALIEQDHGRQLALEIARFMVLVLRRKGGQSQFSPQMMADATEDPRIRRVQLHIWENPCGDLSVGRLATISAMSERSLGRRFKQITNATLSRYIEDVRLSSARKLLETSEQSVQTVAANTGFVTAASMRRVFMRRLGTSPSSYKKSFGADPARISEKLSDADVVQVDLMSVVNGKSAW